VIALLIIFLNERMAREGYLLNKELDMQRRSTNSFLSFIMHGASVRQTPVDALSCELAASHGHAADALPLCWLFHCILCPMQRSGILSMASALNEWYLRAASTVLWTGAINISAPAAISPPLLQASGATTSC
jgi:hypothetical protein